MQMAISQKRGALESGAIRAHRQLALLPLFIVIHASHNSITPCCAAAFLCCRVCVCAPSQLKRVHTHTHTLLSPPPLPANCFLAYLCIPHHPPPLSRAHCISLSFTPFFSPLFHFCNSFASYHARAVRFIPSRLSISRSNLRS